MPLEIIGAGYGRTGTASLKVALEMLGVGPCYHMSEVLRDLRRIDHWLAAADGTADWDEVFDGYAAAVDFPACSFYRELAEHYPNAKVLLSVRDAAGWFESVNETIMSPMLQTFVEDSPFGQLNKRIIWSRFDERLDDREHMVKCFHEHTNQVKRTIPADRLLVYEVKEGWEPLCAFLGKPVPDEPFPRVNSREETKQFLQIMAQQKEGGIDEAALAEAAKQLHG